LEICAASRLDARSQMPLSVRIGLDPGLTGFPCGSFLHSQRLSAMVANQNVDLPLQIFDLGFKLLLSHFSKPFVCW
jgi:hypothetical protein